MTGFRKAVAFVAALVFLIAGYTCATTPSHELLFDANAVSAGCRENGCLVLYYIEIGSTGTRAEENVRVELALAPDRNVPSPITVRNAGKIAVPFSVETGEAARTVVIPSIPPGEWRQIAFAALYEKKEDVTPPSQMVLHATSTAVAGKPGSPTGRRFTRALINMGSIFYG